MSVRVRYAPSPTGSPHVGNIRTALFNHLFAKHHGGLHILRIEDTDRTRLVEGCEAEIMESLRYVGVEWQEGVGVGGPHGTYRQSERKEAGVYEPHWRRMLEDGTAYWAFDTPEELEAMREFQQINKQPTGYFGGEWREATPAQVEAAQAAGKPGVIRLKVPRGERIVLDDAIRGRIEYDSNVVDDPVLIKADGMPTYHFAAMVDDHLMEVTHVFRGEEWISSAPKHLVLFKAMGWEPPVFVHVPVIKGKDGSKLSKRHGDTACLDYRRAGYLSAALANFIALIGWAPGGDREVMSMDEMAEAFDVRGIQPSPGVFDRDKLDWMNGQYIRSMGAEALMDEAVAYATRDETQRYWHNRVGAEGEPDPVLKAKALERLAAVAGTDRAYALEAVRLEQERVTTLAELGPACEFFFVEEVDFDPKAVEKWFGEPHVPALFEAMLGKLGQTDQAWTVEACERLVRDGQAAVGLEKLGPAVHPIRVALTGKTVGPGLFELMAVLGRERMLARLSKATGRLL
ncbi:MAG: glutamate--tRNA ligase [Fimbriimonadaceae bacterium]|nr:glutamate--tRNA ligase [Fimbriimonadaceae bacterium]QYK55747.1 MAG: glutamate--tRNA ligase [Fimbriimonadaceae bacterium]